MGVAYPFQCGVRVITAERWKLDVSSDVDICRNDVQKPLTFMYSGESITQKKRISLYPDQSSHKMPKKLASVYRGIANQDMGV
jgi:hypothetical protein